MSAVTTNRQLDASEVKAAARGQWPEILSAIGGLPAELLDGRHHPCPKCGGKDRFRLIDPDRGALFCNQCFAKENGDGIAAATWLTGLPFQDVLAKIDDHLGTTNGNGQAHQPKREGKTYPTARDAATALDRCMQRTEQGQRAGQWTYTDLGSEPVAMVVRYDLPTPDGKKQSKTFRPVSKHAAGWRWCDPAGKWPLYCLPSLTTADQVVVVEGEKCADAARGLGLVASTSAHGANAPSKTDWTPLAGKQVIVLPDSDKAGRVYTDAVAGILAKLTPAPVVKVVDLPDLPAGGDIANWIGGSGTPDGLMRLVDAAPEWSAAEPETLTMVNVLPADENQPHPLTDTGLAERFADQHGPPGPNAPAVPCSRCGVRVVELIRRRPVNVCRTCNTRDVIELRGGPAPISFRREHELLSHHAAALKPDLPKDAGVAITRETVAELTGPILWLMTLLGDGHTVHRTARQAFTLRTRILLLIEWMGEIHGLTVRRLRKISRLVDSPSDLPRAIREYLDARPSTGREVA